MKTQLLIIVLLLCLSVDAPRSSAQNSPNRLPASTRVTLNRSFPGWKFVDVSPEVEQFLRQQLKQESPVVISGDFDGDRSPDYAALIKHGHRLNYQNQVIGPRYFLVIFLRRTSGYKLYVVKDPGGDYISVARKGTRDYNYETQKEVTYANDAIVASIWEKGASSYVYKKGRFISFVSGD